MEKNKYSLVEYSIMILYIMLSLFNGMGLSNLITLSNNNSYIVVIISFIINIPLLMLFNYILNYKKDLSLKDKISYLYGKYIGFIINVIINIIYIILGSIILNNIYLNVVNTVLYSNNYITFIIFLTIAIIYSNSKGGINIARVSIIFFIIIIMVYLTGLFGLINGIDINNLFPILDSGIKPIIKNSIHFSITNFIPVFILLNISKNKIDENSKINKYMVIFYIVSFVIMTTITFLTISNLGILSKYYTYKEYNLYKKITLFGFLDRIENIIYISWIPISIISISFILNVITSNVYKKSKYMIPTILLLIMVIPIIFIKPYIFDKFTIRLYPYINIVMLFILIISAVNIFIRKILKTT